MSGDLYARALAAVDGLAAFDAAIAAVSAKLAELAPIGAETISALKADNVQAVIGDALAGRDVALTAGSAVAELLTAAEVRAVDRDVTLDALTTLHQGRTAVLRRGADDAFAVFHSELEDILAEADELLDILGPIDSAERAIEAGVTEAYTAFRSVAARYVAVRDAQVQLVAEISPARPGGVADVHAAARLVGYAGLHEDPGAVDPIAAAERRIETDDSGNRLRVRADPMWPAPSDASPAVPTSDPVRPASDRRGALVGCRV